MMKIGFSSLVCPAWDLEMMIAQASKLGFDCIELRGLRGELHLPAVTELTGDPGAVRKQFADGGVGLAALGCSATLGARNRRTAAQQKEALVEFIELAQKLECPHVRLFLGSTQKWELGSGTLARIIDNLAEAATVAGQCDVTLLVENGNDFPGSRDLWQVADAVSLPSLRCCWNQCTGMIAGERPTESLPRLSAKLGMVHFCDAVFDDHGLLLEYTSLGDGQCEVARQIELLKGMAYDRYVIFEWPKPWVEALAEPETLLPTVSAYLREQLNAKQAVLSAYKGDKRAPKMAPRPTLPTRN